jgi:hypothetical protein
MTKDNPAFEQALVELKDALARWKRGELDAEPRVSAPEFPAEADPFLSDDPEATMAFPVRRRKRKSQG